MTDTILGSIRELNWVTSDYSNFDAQLIPKINAALMILNQIGIGIKGFRVETGEETWEDFLGGSEVSIGVGGLREYVGQKVRQMFDPILEQEMQIQVRALKQSFTNRKTDPFSPFQETIFDRGTALCNDF